LVLLQLLLLFADHLPSSFALSLGCAFVVGFVAFGGQVYLVGVLILLCFFRFVDEILLLFRLVLLLVLFLENFPISQKNQERLTTLP
jgi:hypothetical protein